MQEEIQQINSVLVATVGTGGENNPVWEAIAYSVNHHRPDFVCWLCSAKTANDTLPKVRELLNGTLAPEAQETHISDDPDHIQRLFLEYLEVFDRIRSSWPESKIVADFTSGTKAMSAALSMAATARQVKALAYLTGLRDASGRATVTTQAISFEPAQIYAQGMLDRAMDYFNRKEYQTAKILAEQVRCGLRLENPELSQKAFLIEGLAKIYKRWDLFSYKKARKKLLTIARQPEWTQDVRAKLEANLSFLDVCVEGRQDADGRSIEAKWTPERLLDLYLNAKRRFEMGEYDDCVSRCYRLMEYIAQQLLHLSYGIETGSVPVETLKNPQAKELLDKNGKIGLTGAYRLLELEFDDDLGKAFRQAYCGNGTWENPKGSLAGGLGSRNQSLLAHGYEPVSEKASRAILETIKEWLIRWIPEFNELAASAEFVQINYQSFGTTSIQCRQVSADKTS